MKAYTCNKCGNQFDVPLRQDDEEGDEQYDMCPILTCKSDDIKPNENGRTNDRPEKHRISD